MSKYAPEFAAVRHLDGKRCVTLIELPSGNLLLQATDGAESRGIDLSTEAAISISDLLRVWIDMRTGDRLEAKSGQVRQMRAVSP